MAKDEILGEKEYEEEQRRKQNTVDTAAFEAQGDMDFGGGESTADFGFKDQGKDMDSLDMNEGDSDMRQSVLIGFRKNANVKYEDFKLLMLLGRGTFGKVFLAELKSEGKKYAIKAIRKDVLIEYNQVQNTKLEKDILFSCDHPFLVGMDYLF